MTMTATQAPTGGRLAKTLGRTPGGLKLRASSRRADAWHKGGAALGKAGHWLGDGDGPIGYAGRSKDGLDGRVAEALAVEAAVEYLSRRDRLTHPDGEFDDGGRWYPDSLIEHQTCCYAVRSPSRAWPYSYMVHCRTAAHVAALYGAEAKKVKRYARRLEEAFAEGGALHGAQRKVYALDAGSRALALGAVVAGDLAGVEGALGDADTFLELTPLSPKEEAERGDTLRQIYRVIFLYRLAGPEVLGVLDREGASGA